MSDSTSQGGKAGAEGATPDDAGSNALDYTRRLFTTVFGWYTSAESKAQILLTLNGALLGFLGSAAFWGGDQLGTTLKTVGYETLFFFVAFLVALAGSIVSALMCLKSRLRHLDQEVEDPTPGNLWFFQLLPLVDRNKFAAKLQQISAAAEIEILSSQIQILSFNVISKHVWVNRAVKSFVAGLLFFMMLVATYIIRLYAGITDRWSCDLVLGSVIVVSAAVIIYWIVDAQEKGRETAFQTRFLRESGAPGRQD